MRRLIGVVAVIILVAIVAGFMIFKHPVFQEVNRRVCEWTGEPLFEPVSPNFDAPFSVPCE